MRKTLTAAIVVFALIAAACGGNESVPPTTLPLPSECETPLSETDVADPGWTEYRVCRVIEMSGASLDPNTGCAFRPRIILLEDDRLDVVKSHRQTTQIDTFTIRGWPDEGDEPVEIKLTLFDVTGDVLGAAEELRSAGHAVVVDEVYFPSAQIYQYGPYSDPAPIITEPTGYASGSTGVDIVAFDMYNDITVRFGPNEFIGPMSEHGEFVSSIIGASQIDERTPPGTDLFFDEWTLTQEFVSAEIVGQLVNLSLGKVGCLGEGADTDSPTYRIMRMWQETNDALVVAAAGAQGTKATTDLAWYPARLCAPDGHDLLCDMIVSVGSLDGGAEVTSWTRSAWVYALGENVVGAYPRQGEYALFTDQDHPADAFTGTTRVFGNVDNATWSGTSFATPQVTAAFANAIAAGSKSGRELWAAMYGQGPTTDIFIIDGVLPAQ